MKVPAEKSNTSTPLDFSMDALPKVAFMPKFSNPELRPDKMYKAAPLASVQEEHLSCCLGVSNVDACRILLTHDVGDPFCFARGRDDSGANLKISNPLDISPERLAPILEDPAFPDKVGQLTPPVGPESSSILYTPWLTTEGTGASCYRIYPPAKRPKAPSRNFKDEDDQVGDPRREWIAHLQVFFNHQACNAQISEMCTE